MAEHRVQLVQRVDALRAPLPPACRSRCASSSNSAAVFGRNSCSGGSSRRMVTGRPSMTRNSSTKSSRCIGSSLASAARRPSASSRQDHLAHRDDAVVVEEHVLGAAQADAFGAEPTRGQRASSGVSALARTLERARSCRPSPSAWRNRRSARAGSSAPRRASPRRSVPSSVIKSPSFTGHVAHRACVCVS